MHGKAVILSSLVSVVALAAPLSVPFFLGAPAGVEVPFVPVNLPPPAVDPELGDLPFLSRVCRSAFTPSLHQLLEGETIVKTEKQMREVWGRLFGAPYDASQFDFSDSFVVLMGGGSIVNGTFDITAVEQVEADYANPGGIDDPATEAFLSVTSTTFLSGVPPQDPPPPSWRLAAVKVSRALLDDVVFRRNVVLGM